MKKTLLLSVVASTMIMAGGDIAPVEPVVETPVVADSGWDFNGQSVVYYQTRDNATDDLFSQESAAAAAGIQLSAVNKDVVGGIGAGFELSGLSSLGLHNDVVSSMVQNAGLFNGAAITQAYLTYGIGNTSLKIGRQQLPKSLSPFAFSEGWNVFKNTFNAALLVNSDLPDTTLVGAYVTRSNGHSDLNKFNRYGKSDGVAMLTAQNKSIDGLTLTGTYYLAADYSTAGDAQVLWADAKFNVSDYSIALQGGQIFGDAVKDAETTAYGVKVGANLGMFGASVAYSSVDDGAVAIQNLGAGTSKSPLYTQMVLNNLGAVNAQDVDYLKLSANTKALGGKFIANYGYAIEKRDGKGNDTKTNPYELDLMYKTKVGNTNLFAAYVLTDADVKGEDSQNFLRFWARYNF